MHSIYNYIDSHTYILDKEKKGKKEHESSAASLPPWKVRHTSLMERKEEKKGSL